MTEQSQSGGIGSTNTQIGHVSIGMSYSDVRDIATDVFNANFLVLKGVAHDTLETRRAELVDAVIERLKNENIHELAGFAHPEKQIALYEAQKAFALSGDSALKIMLVDTIAQLAQEPERSLKSIVLHEAIKTMPSLTARQVSAVSAAFLMRSVGFHSAGTLSHLFEKIERGLGDIASLKGVSDGDFRHLEFTRCGVVEIGNVDFLNILKQNYPGLVSAGMFPDAVTSRFSEIGQPVNGLIASRWVAGNYQIAATNRHVLDIKAEEYSWTAAQKSAAVELLEANVLDDARMKDVIFETSKFASDFYDIWASTDLNSLKLSSVGIAVAHSYCSTNGLELPELEIWL